MLKRTEVNGTNIFTTKADIGSGNQDWNFEYLFQLKEDTKDSYDIYIFNKSTISPQEIYQVSVRTKSEHGKLGNTGRIGWIFPVQIFEEDPTTLDIFSDASYKHFLPYAYHAFEKLLLREFNQSTFELNIPSIKPKPLTKLTEWYGDNAIVLVISKERKNFYAYDFSEELDVFNFLPSLLQYGYWYQQDVSQRAFPGMKLNALNILPPAGNKILIGRTSKELDDIYIVDLFSNILIKEESPISQFHLLYQIIEILIDKVFIYEIQLFPDKFQEIDADFYSLKEDLNKLTKESLRLVKIYESFIGTDTNKPKLDSLNIACTNILTNIGVVPNPSGKPLSVSKTDLLIDFHKNNLLTDIMAISKDTTISDKAIEDFIGKLKNDLQSENNKKDHALYKLYKVRSTTFHNFKKIGSANLSLLFLVNTHFLDIIIEFLMRFTTNIPKQKKTAEKVETIHTADSHKHGVTWIRIKKPQS